MPTLNLSFLGPFVATLDGRSITNFRTQKVQALLIYLAVERDTSHNRESLMTLLWPDMNMESAQVNLRQSLYRLRQAIPDLKNKEDDNLVPLLISDRQRVQINPNADIKIDVEDFYKWIDSDPDKAVDLYHGDFLSKFFVADSNQFETWAENIREDLRRKVLQALDQLTDFSIHQEDYDQAQHFAWRQLEIDNLRESAYRQLMLALTQVGQRTAALSQYQICRKRLKEELGINPSPETSMLYEQIQADALNQTKSAALEHTKRTSDRMPVFLLTDIENSTRMWDTHHQAMLAALLKHNTILEDQITNYGGRILELRGDGVKAVFEGGDPLACLLSIQKELGSVDWGEIGELKIRMGLHGVPTVRKGYDFFQEDDKYYGPVLNHTARIMDAGWGGQILVSEQIHNSCALPPDASWRDFGRHKVKSLDHEVQIYGLIHPDLPHQSFPSLRTLTNRQENLSSSTPEPFPHNLPQQATAFVGRQAELADLVDLLEKPKNRLISIVGPGGMGKTRLALALAELLLQACLSGEKDCQFSNGIFFVPLASLDEPDRIFQVIANVLEIPIDSGQSNEVIEQSQQTDITPKKRLMSFLENKHSLLFLDNFEHLVDGADLVSGILATCPHLHIVITSRERLHIREEQVYPIQGLKFPIQEAPEDPCDFTAMELFLQSAQRVLPNFELKTDDLIHLTRICNLVGGMPLGLELAASWVDMLSIKDIAEEIQNSIDFLETDLRNVPGRHRSMRAVFDSSWNRLSIVEKQVFSRFSLLRGCFSRTAAQEIAGASIRNLSSFVSKTLLHYDQTTDCYQIHELLRQYGEEHLLRDSSEVIKTREKHCAYYCEAIHRHMDTLMSGESHIAFERIRADIDNIWRAWTWAIEHQRVANVNRAFNGLCMYYASEWGIDTGIKVCNEAIKMITNLNPEQVVDNGLKNRLHAKALSWLGFYLLQIDPEKAMKEFDRSKEIINELMKTGFDVRHEQALLYFFIGVTYTNIGDPESAKKYTKECLALSKETGFHWMVLNALDLLGDICDAFGSPRDAQNWYEQSLFEARARQNTSGEIRALQSLGWAARHLMAYDEAKSFYEQALSLAKSYGNPLEKGFAFQSLGFLSIFLGEFEPAIQYFQQASSISEHLGVPYRTIAGNTHIGFCYWMLGEFKQAEFAYQNILNIVDGKAEVSKIFTVTSYAEYLIMIGDYSAAKTQLQIAETISSRVFVGHFAKGRLARTLGWFALAEKNYSLAKHQFEESIKLYEVNADDEQIAWSQAGLARTEIGLGNHHKAKSLLIDALWTVIEMRAFIPLVFILPITALYLAKRDPEWARSIVAQYRSFPFLADSQYFKDIVENFLPVEVKDSLQVEDNLVADNYQHLWDAASGIMFKWMRVWLDEPTSVEHHEG